MAIQFACQCGKTLKAAEEHAGKRAKCKHCGQVVVIPGGKMAAPKAVPPAQSPAAAVPKKTAPVAAARAASLPAAKPASEPVTNFDLDDFYTANLPSSLPEASFATSQSAAASAESSRTCPGCFQSVSSAAVICTLCGHNFKTGKKMATTFERPISYDVPLGKNRRPSAIGSFFHSRLTSGKLWSGVGMMVGAAVWFVGGLAINRIFFYPPILFILGVISFFTGLIDGDKA